MPLRPERRLAPRRNTMIKASIVFDGGRSVRSCIIRNVSENGAKLELASVAGVPDTFDLLIPGHAPQPCRVAWRALKEMGVAYRTG
jgi:hypothetical protein